MWYGRILSISTQEIIAHVSQCECIKAIQSQQNNTVQFCFNLTGKHTRKRVQYLLNSMTSTKACDKKRKINDGM